MLDEIKEKTCLLLVSFWCLAPKDAFFSFWCQAPK